MAELRELEDIYTNALRVTIRETETVERAYRDARREGYNLDRALSEVRHDFDNITRRFWVPNNPAVRTVIEDLSEALSDRGFDNLPNTDVVNATAYELAEADEINGYTRRDRVHLNTDEAVRRIFNNRSQQEDFEEKEARMLDFPDEEEIDLPYRGMPRNARVSILRRKADEFRRYNLNIAGFKRLLFAEKNKQIQYAQIEYLTQAGFYFVKWRMHPTHPKSDICDVCARNVWLSERDQEEYTRITGRTDYGGVIPLAHREFGWVIPELRGWSGNKIANAILQFGTRDGYDLRRKRSGHFPAHPLCKCYLSPILESRV